MNHECSSCGWVFEREEGYWTGAMAVNLIVTEALIFIAIFPLLIQRAPLLLTLGIGLAFAVLTPFLFYWHSKSLWMAVDFLLHPTPLVTPTHIMTVEELRALASRPSPESRAPGSAPKPLDMDQQ
ncbi:MAG TPA: DUF983 domain-containing protein [Ktedonobacterales bacterium]